MIERLKRLRRWASLGPVALLLVALLRWGEEFDSWRNFFRDLKEAADHYGILRRASSPEFLIVAGFLWLGALIMWPDLRKRLPLSMLVGRQIRLRTWIDEGDRHEILNKRLEQCKRGEKVRFITFTGRSVLLPGVAGKKLQEYPFPRAVDEGARFEGVLLDPESEEAKFRSNLESPGIPLRNRLLQNDSRLIREELPDDYERAGIRDVKKQVQLKYVKHGLQFSLWLFHDMALMEPYHLGRRQGVGNLCEFAQIIVPADDPNYQLLADHFANMWNDKDATAVWT